MDYQQNEPTQPQNYNYDYDYDQNDGYNNESSGTKGLKIAIILLGVVLVAVTFLYWRSVQQAKSDKDMLEADKIGLTNELDSLNKDLGIIRISNDTLNQVLITERGRADSILKKLKKENNISYARIKQYQREIGTLRSTMQSFVRQIDSLGRLNKKLTGQVVQFQEVVRKYKLTADKAIEVATEANQKLNRAARVGVRDISLTPLNNKDKVATRAKQARKLQVSLVLSENTAATPGKRTVYVAIVNPQGLVLTERQGATVNIEGSNIPYTAAREVDYDGEALRVSLYYVGNEIDAGQYTIIVYMDGSQIGTTLTVLK